jgi:hypothetical protein
MFVILLSDGFVGRLHADEANESALDEALYQQGGRDSNPRPPVLETGALPN